jgi:hypothetical protein
MMYGYAGRWNVDQFFSMRELHFRRWFPEYGPAGRTLMLPHPRGTIRTSTTTSRACAATSAVRRQPPVRWNIWPAAAIARWHGDVGR